MSLSAVNLLWQKRFRGLMPVAVHGTADSGHALVIRPDELEHRTYQVMSIDSDGEARELGAISVETVYRFEGAPDGRLLIGMTGDDIYLFREGRKQRFMAERRLSYSDISLSPETGWFVCSYSDALFASHGVAFGDASGRVGWSKDLETPAARVALALDGRTLAIGMPSGEVRSFDNMRNPKWVCAQDEGVTAMAMPGSGPSVVVGTDTGTVLSLDDDGGFRWRSPVGLPVVALCVDRANHWVASAHSDGTTHLLVCLGPDGAPVWEYDLDAKPNGVSLAPNGRRLAVSTVNGVVSCFEVDFSLARGQSVGSRVGRDLAAAAAAEEAGDLERAHELLQGLSLMAPWDEDVAGRFIQTREALVASLRDQAEALRDGGDWHDALARLEQAAAVEPLDGSLLELRREYVGAASQALGERAAALEAAYDYESATALWTGILTLDPRRAEAREALRRIRARQASELMAEGDACLGKGDLERAIALWQQAQKLEPSDNLADRLRRVEVERCVATGIAHYEAQRMAEATFQFKKALALDPGNEQAQRYLGYTEGVTGDTTIADRFARLGLE